MSSKRKKGSKAAAAAAASQSVAGAPATASYDPATLLCKHRISLHSQIIQILRRFLPPFLAPLLLTSPPHSLPSFVAVPLLSSLPAETEDRSGVFRASETNGLSPSLPGYGADRGKDGRGRKEGRRRGRQQTRRWTDRPTERRRPQPLLREGKNEGGERGREGERERGSEREMLVCLGRSQPSSI